MKALIRSLMPRTVRPRRILAGPLRGRWLVTSWHDYPAALTGRTELPLLRWFARTVRQGETWIDVGAHYGYTAFALAGHVGATGRVFAFEPMASTAGSVERGRELNGLAQLTVLPFGLGSPETLAIHKLPITRGMADSTLSRDAAAWLVSLPIARFDWLWPIVNGGVAKIDGVKIDVQGMELETLNGMREMLRAWRPRLVVELHQGVSRPDVLTLLKDLGYSAPAIPIEPAPGETAPLFLDNRSYAFLPA